ncbi:MAG TPA: hypothetical protein DCG75_02165 [Bacteroidales bacterium]|jgi:hypothetical protein|nr:hypothetical protein [Bacteroidales bacterium]
MRKIALFVFVFTSFQFQLLAQYLSETTWVEEEKTACVTIGILQGGGALVGADFEFLISNRVGFQAGIGYIAFGAAINYHLKPTIRSSFISFNYWNQGIGPSFAQNLVGASFVFRGKRWFTAQIGLGVPLEKGPAMPDDYEQSPIMLTYSIGAYIPF